MNSSSSFGFSGSSTSYVLKPNRPVMTSTSLPRTLSNLPSVIPFAPAIRVRYSRFDEIAAPGGGSAATHSRVPLSKAPSTTTAAPIPLIRPSLSSNFWRCAGTY